MSNINYEYVFSSNLNKIYKNNRNGFSCKYYSKAQMKSTYPNGGFKVVGQIGYGKNKIAKLRHGEREEDVFDLKSSFIYRADGYIACGDDEYIVVFKNFMLWWLLLLVLFLTLSSAVIYGINTIRSGTDEEPTTENVIDADARPGEGELSVPDKIETSDKKIKINGIPEMKLKANQKQQNFIFSNPEKNPCYFIIEVYVLGNDDNTVSDDELIYKSDLLPPGYSISKFEINRALDAGNYKARINYLTYSFDKEKRPLNNMNIKTELIVS